ncbi:unnamed protein product [Adineta ricciae]|uniref:Uncharacterized protein n=1 Tax=Adineta ricciae TaxID=249248 RepID=A0A815WV37_ADIRI|nr:unnamed protein product [Adineta ricciae]
MFIKHFAHFGIVILISLLALPNFILLKFRLKSSPAVISVSKNQTYIQPPQNDKFTRCLLHAEKAFNKLPLPWFLAFGRALMYHRSNNFISDDIAIGIFYNDLNATRLSSKKLISTLRKFRFRLLITYGQLNYGQGWTFRCPNSKVRFEIFVFDEVNFK